MKYDPVSRLSKHMDLMLTRESPPSVLLETMRLTRLVIEKGNAATRYPTVAMYCNWVMHPELNCNPGAWNVLKLLDVEFCDVLGKNESELNEKISKGLGLAKLRSEFISLCKEKKVNPSLFLLESNWIQFQQVLLDDLQEREIGFQDDIATSPKARGRSVYDQMLAHRAAIGQSADAIRRVTINRKETGVDGRPPGYYWTIRIRQETPEHYVDLNGYFHVDAGGDLTV